jgi:hypothetical protein
MGRAAPAPATELRSESLALRAQALPGVPCQWQLADSHHLRRQWQWHHRDDDAPTVGGFSVEAPRGTWTCCLANPRLRLAALRRHDATCRHEVARLRARRYGHWHLALPARVGPFPLARRTFKAQRSKPPSTLRLLTEYVCALINVLTCQSGKFAWDFLWTQAPDLVP